MAKSLRSKRERKLRRVKRVRYGKKELERLKNMLGIKDTTTDADMQAIEDVTVKTTTELKMSARQKHIMREIKKMNECVGDLEGESGRLKRLGDSKTYTDEKGNYPEWMPRRKIKKLKSNERRDKRHEKKKRKKEEQFRTKNKKQLKAKKKKGKKTTATSSTAISTAAK
uniref:Protein LLP homolog n=1 Tax=Cacopsylla melanoneura TaxID=428564 RepID=A0A8D9FET5_9HEMI